MNLSGTKDVRNGIELLQVFTREPDPEKGDPTRSTATLKELIKYNYDMLWWAMPGRHRRYWLRETAKKINETRWTQHLGWWTRRKLKKMATLKIEEGRRIPEFQEILSGEIKQLVYDGNLEQAIPLLRKKDHPSHEDLYGKREFAGTILSVQPRIRKTRSFTESSNQYLGYNLHLKGTAGTKEGKFTVAVGKAAHAKHGFCKGQHISGLTEPVAEPRRETAQYYKVSKIKLNGSEIKKPGPPSIGIPPPLEVYRKRGARRLDRTTYNRECRECYWGARMAVEIIPDQWNQSRIKYRYETFCYGPKSCPLHRAGEPRKVPGRNGETWVEPDWVYINETQHRGTDE